MILVIKSNLGDANARNKLIEHNLRIVAFLAKKYDGTMKLVLKILLIMIQRVMNYI